MAGEKLKQAWFCTTGLPSDVVIEVADMSFHLHKFPLMSKSRMLHQLITLREQTPRSKPSRGEDVEEIEEEEQDEEGHHISLSDFPGGAGAFEAAAKFCYNVRMELTAWTAVPVLCAAHYLEMRDEFSHDNLFSRAEHFLAHNVLRSVRDSAKALKSCEDDEELFSFADGLGLVQRCIDAIAHRLSIADPSTLLGWPVNDASGGGGSGRQPPLLWNGIDTGMTRRWSDSWFEDLAMLRLPTYKRLVEAMKEKGLSLEAIEGSLVSYAKRSIPGLSRSARKQASAPVVPEPEQRDLLETVVANLPLETKPTAGRGMATTARFLFGLLRTANILRASEASRAALERRIASQLEQASLDDLLMPSYSYLVETLYDVDCVQRIVAHFLERLQGSGKGAPEEEDPQMAAARLAAVGKLVDGYLAEIASDANLRPEKFCDLALAIPDHARLYDDGLYRAVDLYLKAHGGMAEEERERICGVMDCQKMTLEACTHAAQNERLPLRAIVQVLFFEQLQLRQAVAGTLMAAAGEVEQGSPARRGRRGEEVGEGGAWRSAARENQALRVDMDSMRSRVQELERECSTMRRAITKIDGGDGGRKASLRKRIGCKFRTQVCDSRERAVVDARRSRTGDTTPSN